MVSQAVHGGDPGEGAHDSFIGDEPVASPCPPKLLPTSLPRGHQRAEASMATSREMLWGQPAYAGPWKERSQGDHETSRGLD